MADLRRAALAALLLVPVFVLLLGAPSAQAAPATTRVAAVAHAAGPSLVTAPNPTPTTTSTAPSVRPSSGSGNVSVNLDPGVGKPSQTVSIILLLTVLSIAPALLVLCTAFTKVIVVLSLTRNALGTPTIPPNQVLAGLALFLSLFIMAPVQSLYETFGSGIVAGDTGILLHNRGSGFNLTPGSPDQIAPHKRPLHTLIPAFVLSELKSAFIIGFVIFIPFLVIDLVVSSSLMSMGMMMLPPVLISLPFKLLLFVMVDGWDLIAKALVTSYHP